MIPTMHDDPSGLVGTLSTAAGAILALLVAFGVDLTAEQLEALLAVVAVVIGPLVAYAIRRHAWAPASVERVRAEERARFTDPPAQVPYFPDDNDGGEVPA